jgi:regulator of protease activity HflC (stomatin/prohibitin superfamily)
MRATAMLLAMATALSVTGCASEDIPQAYRGRMFGRTGPLAFYTGRTGFYGEVLGPGTYFTGTYDELHKIECSTMTVREPLTALTKDGVQFGLNIYVRFSPDCSDTGVKTLLSALPVDRANDVTAALVYQTYVQPAVGEAAREVVSPVRANDVNDQREEILASIRKRFLDIIAQREKNVATIYEVNLSNLDFPDDMDKANTERAIQAILRDKAIAERERVTAEIKTMEMRRELAQREGEMEAARIAQVGEALRRYPAFLQYDLQARMPEIYRQAGAQGNLVITAPNPSVFVTPRAEGAASPAPRPVMGAAERQPGSAARPKLMGGTIDHASPVPPAQPPAEVSPYDAP